MYSGAAEIFRTGDKVRHYGDVGGSCLLYEDAGVSYDYEGGYLPAAALVPTGWRPMTNGVAFGF